MRLTRAILAASILMAGTAAFAIAQPAPSGSPAAPIEAPASATPAPQTPAPTAPAAPAAPAASPARPAPRPAQLRAFDAEIDRACFRRLALAALVQRVAALRAAGHDESALYGIAPTAMLTLARLHRQAGDAASATTIYEGLAGATSDDGRRSIYAHERDMMAAEQSLVAGGAARPEEGALLADLRDAPGAGGPYRIAQWVKPDCTPFATGDGRSSLVLYRPDAGGGGQVVGDPVGSAGNTFLFEDDGWGSDVTGDGRPVLPITEANGGNCRGCSRLRLFIAGPGGLATLPVEAPGFVVPQALARVGGRTVLVASDVRWERFADVCDACAPGVAVLLAWGNGRFEPACRELRDTYRAQLDALGPGLAERDPQVRFGAITSRLLIRIQIGEADPAWPEYRHALGVLRRLRGGPRDGFRVAQNQLATALRAARPALAEAACPVDALAIH
jgi:hypothetical protein